MQGPKGEKGPEEIFEEIAEKFPNMKGIVHHIRKRGRPRQDKPKEEHTRHVAVKLAKPRQTETRKAAKGAVTSGPMQAAPPGRQQVPKRRSRRDVFKVMKERNRKQQEYSAPETPVRFDGELKAFQTSES